MKHNPGRKDKRMKEKAERIKANYLKLLGTKHKNRINRQSAQGGGR